MKILDRLIDAGDPLGLGPLGAYLCNDLTEAGHEKNCRVGSPSQRLVPAHWAYDHAKASPKPSVKGEAH